MRKTLILVALALPAFAAPPFDFKQLDKLGANAKESTNITLEGPMLKMASGLMGDDNPSAKSLLENLKGVYIRTFEFDEAGKYNDADLEPLRTYLDAQHWTKIVDVKDRQESTGIYVLSLPGDKPGGFAIISAEPKEVTIVFIEGPVSMGDLGKLSGSLGIPDLNGLGDGKKSSKRGKKDQEEDK
jgi:hypothetical protein